MWVGREEMRTYNYNQDDFQGLFVRVVERLSAPEESSNLVSNTLTEICEHFRFGCGVIYENDHSGVLHLKENYATYHNCRLRNTIKLVKDREIADLEQSLKAPLYISSAWTGEQYTETDIYKIFGANSILLIPIADSESKLIGLVGMLDRRHNILTREADIGVAETVLRLLANYIKLRIYQRKVEMTRESLVKMLDNMGIDIYVNDFYTHEILYVNRSMAIPYGGLDKLLGKKCWQALYNDKAGQCDYCPQLKLIDEHGFPSKVYSWDYQRPFDGSWFRVFSAAFNWVDGRLAHVVSSVDITENKRNEALVSRMATIDALTDLPNRRKLFIDFQAMSGRLADDNANAYLLFFDLDNFKAINDTMGHQAGDSLLRGVAHALLDNPLTSDHIYRHGGDEFVLLYGNSDRSDINRIVDLVLGRFNMPWPVGGSDVVCRASMGVARYPDDGATIEDLIQSADKMMYEAKRLGKGVACFCDGGVMKAKTPYTRKMSKRGGLDNAPGGKS